MRITKLVSVVVLGSLFAVGCGKYKTFQEEAAELNGQYMAQMTDIFKQSNRERKASIEQAQQTYDQAFATIAKKWKVDANTVPEHLKFQEVFCKQTFQSPYDDKVDEIIGKYSADFQEAFNTRNGDKMNSIAVKSATELGTATGLYSQKAKTAGCSLAEMNASDLMDALVGGNM